MQTNEMEKWIKDFYKKRNWAEYGPFIRLGFLMEETGELARAVRAIEIGRDRPDEQKQKSAELKRELVEEMGDVLGNLLILADFYDVTVEEIFSSHQQKLTKRFSELKST
ncbi:MazG nucleotide pyrophosphohydrolase domain-containing protein [Bacillus pumilus]|uniref:MazG nucleotide pyrophosphohydrolase domain-containing protein n=1 Tax=Bacillus pumilus TaxID=1408 RepID=UPI001C21B011|nr:MazG-like family protein [Bacillus pumilus]MBU8637587.1 MazG-like family protein [Bacillus pumilus]